MSTKQESTSHIHKAPEFSLKKTLYISIEGGLPNNEGMSTISSRICNSQSENDIIFISDISLGKFKFVKNTVSFFDWFCFFPRQNDYKDCLLYQSNNLNYVCSWFRGGCSRIKEKPSIDPCIGILASKEEFLMHCELFNNERRGEIIYREEE
ncbi:MAG: hypothetical protein COV57_02350 [Candidatus Liptonbacteria bacterium CG11_big_fil_rev_8_21_14_0_20_35_14]|uniref:Uncharacterized protein n=1 Tax=Candidatus Liptonbacteria bacterium CG11_big_fil_rev_8_21_14_0_20_35_14 TaxID=1974634 RepID=A0A2H0N7I3_9BACT|nr:MAG: hypothetical protein COV57_02350 [Candidatus Liptonbacteria bacterium CG11_big_fil_rev_8_21_14_0_20_35_14]